MSIFEEFQKLKKSKTNIRKAIQQNGSNMETSSNLVNYSTAIDEFDGTFNQDFTGVKEYNINSYTQMKLENITELRDSALQGNTSLKELVLNVEIVVSLGKDVFKNTRFETDGKIYVPDSILNDYLSDSTWNKYNIEPISNFVENQQELYPLQTLDRHFTVGKLKNLTIGEIERK